MAAKVSPKFSPAECAALYAKAHEAGMAAAAAKVPEPMYVVRRANPLDDKSPVVQRYAPVMDGVCGFAWVNVKPANGSFGRWMKAEGKARPAYGGGLQVWVAGFNQSMEKKEAYAYAMAKVLCEAGVDAYAGSRMD